MCRSRSAAGSAEGDGEAQEKGSRRLPGRDRGTQDRAELLGQGLVRQSRALFGLREPPAARTNLCPQRLGDRFADRARKVEALVSGSEIYKVKIDIAVAAPARWKAICRDCAGSVGSLIELLQGKLSKNVMERVCREADGLFPAPAEIEMSCSCPDWADMCKHVAATLYGVGARLDSDPDLVFTLRGVDRTELVSRRRRPAADARRGGERTRARRTTTSRRCSASKSPRPTRRPRSRRRSKASRRKDWRAPEPRRPLCFRRRSRTRRGSRRAPLRRRRPLGVGQKVRRGLRSRPKRLLRQRLRDRRKPPRARRQKSQRSRRASRNQAPPTRGPDE